MSGDKLTRYEEALRSIAANTCCDRCREAALVAQEALHPREATGQLTFVPLELSEETRRHLDDIDSIIMQAHVAARNTFLD